MATATTRERAATLAFAPSARDRAEPTSATAAWMLRPPSQEGHDGLNRQRERSRSARIASPGRVGLSLDDSSSEDESSTTIATPSPPRIPAPHHHLPNNRTQSSPTTTAINWSLVYSSDEETANSSNHHHHGGSSTRSSSSHRNNNRQRSYSEPSMDSSGGSEESASAATSTRPTAFFPPPVDHHHHFEQRAAAPRRQQDTRRRLRSTSITHVGTDAVTAAGAAALVSENSRHHRRSGGTRSNSSSSSSRGFLQSWNLRCEASSNLFLQKCTPFRVLAALFCLSCYTTFWLPYPEVPAEHQSAQPNFPLMQSQQTHNLRPGGGWAHFARGSPNGQAALTYQQPESTLTPSPLQRYYQQEGFSSSAQSAYWTKYANIGALALVLVWAVIEHKKRRREQQEEQDPSNL